MAVSSGTVNYTAGGICKGKGFMHSLVAVWVSQAQRPDVCFVSFHYPGQRI